MKVHKAFSITEICHHINIISEYLATKSLTNLIASIICSPMFTQLAACCGRDIGKPDTQ